jgi:hypothetical protein
MAVRREPTYTYEGVTPRGGWRIGYLLNAETPTAAVARAYREGWASFQVRETRGGRLVARKATVA